MNSKDYVIERYANGVNNRVQLAKELIEQGYETAGYDSVRKKVANWISEVDIRENHPNLADYCDEVGLPVKDVGHYWHKGENHSVFVKEDKDKINFEQIIEDHIKELEGHTFDYKPIKREPINEGHLLVIDPADIHIGKLSTKFGTGKQYDSLTAVERTKEGVNGLLDKAQGFNIDKILFVAGNDVLHIDSIKKTTTGGTIQDTDGMWYDNFLLAKELYIHLIEQLIQIADVHFVYNPSNHDYMSGFFLSQTIKTWFKDCPNVTFDVDMRHRKYFKYGTNLIGTTHGDKGKEKDLGYLITTEAREHWGSTKYAYFYSHHVHHKTSKEYPNLTVETLRSPSAPDMWHSGEGYVASEAIEGFIHSKDKGQIARLTHYFSYDD